MNKSSQHSKPKLVILSDIWGAMNVDWMDTYRSHLEPYFTMQFYDSRMLAGIDPSIEEMDKLHTHFINGGILKAAASLQTVETDYILAFSIGGTIAWKAILKGLRIKQLYAISSTRLRKEQSKVQCDVTLFYGCLDTNMPDRLWQQQFTDQSIGYANEHHAFYRTPVYAEVISNHIIENKSMKDQT